MKFIKDGTIDVEQVLTDMAENPEGKMKFTLPKVLNRATGRETTGPFMFSAANWGGDTASYQESIIKKGAAFISDTVAAVYCMKGQSGNNSSSTGGDAEENGTVNPRAFLCMFFSLLFIFAR